MPVDISYNTNDPCSPRRSITDEDCRKFVLEICQLIAQKSDDGRRALMDAKILPELSYLIGSQKAIEVVSACKILKALAHSGTFKNAIILAGLKKGMKKIAKITRYNFSAFSSQQYLTFYGSPFRRSTLYSKEEKRLVQSYAKEVLETLSK